MDVNSVQGRVQAGNSIPAERMLAVDVVEVGIEVDTGAAVDIQVAGADIHVVGADIHEAAVAIENHAETEVVGIEEGPEMYVGCGIAD